MFELSKVLAVATIAGVVLKAYLDKRRQGPAGGLPYPPGPKATLPFLGNINDVPKSYPWLTYTKWGETYGDIMHFTIFGAHVIVINSLEVANDLLEKRSKKYSDRPEIPVMQLNGWHISMGLKHYSDEWRRDRRILHQRFRPEAAPSLYPLELAKAQQLLHDLLQSPKEYVFHLQNYPASIVMYLVYGHEIARENDPLVDMTLEALGLFAGDVTPGTIAVNIFPSLRYLPTWFPGLADFHKLCAKSRDLLRKVQDIPFNSVTRNMADDIAVPSWVSELLEKNPINGEDSVPEHIIKALGTLTFAAAMETTLSTLKTFILMMILYPEIQERAQAEIDHVVGNSRLPTFDDRESLPYIDALYRELLRYRGPAPLGLPHAVFEDDIYNGYYIPKGATVMTNQWAMCRDESVYPEADKFKPERFLTPEGELTNVFPPAFGFGRRICAGRSLADNTVWIAIVSILSVFRIAKAKDASGNDIDVSEEYSDGIVTAPLPFECSIYPRSEAARKLILDNPPLKLKSNPMYY